MSAFTISVNLRGQGDRKGSPWPLKFTLMVPSPSCRGDASVPTPHNPSPAPTGMQPLPKPIGKSRDVSLHSLFHLDTYPLE